MVPQCTPIGPEAEPQASAGFGSGTWACSRSTTSQDRWVLSRALVGVLIGHAWAIIGRDHWSFCVGTFDVDMMRGEHWFR
jgi:hypothetical protein